MFFSPRFKMSWLFGMNQRPQDFSQFVPPPAGGAGGDQGGAGDSGDGKKSGAMDAYRFDSSALERAAKAAKELEKSGVCDVLSVLTLHCLDNVMGFGTIILSILFFSFFQSCL